jgi:hypothetical protein
VVVSHHVDGRSLRLQTATTTRLAFGVVLAHSAGYSTTIESLKYFESILKLINKKTIFENLSYQQGI